MESSYKEKVDIKALSTFYPTSSISKDSLNAKPEQYATVKLQIDILAGPVLQ